MADTNDFVRVRNTGDRPLRIVYDSKVTTVAPGQEGIVAREAAKIHFGDWEVLDDERRPWRTDEYRRIRGLAGCNEHGVSAMNDLRIWEERQPHVELYEGDGTRIVTVIEDPAGLQRKAVVEVDRDAQLKFLQEQVELLMAARDDERRVVTNEPTSILEDKPEVRRGRPRQAAVGEAD